jgi:hypothetical protein
MKVFKANVFSVVHYALGSEEVYGVAVVFVDGKNNPYKIAIRANKGSQWTYDREHIIVHEMSKTGLLVNVKRDASQVAYKDENGEDAVQEYSAKEYDLVLTDLEQIKL